MSLYLMVVQNYTYDLFVQTIYINFLKIS